MLFREDVFLNIMKTKLLTFFFFLLSPPVESGSESVLTSSDFSSIAVT
jgi:hypothetical protein